MAKNTSALKNGSWTSSQWYSNHRIESAPRYWEPNGDGLQTHLAYITEEEIELLKRYGKKSGRPLTTFEGPSGLPFFATDDVEVTNTTGSEEAATNVPAQWKSSEEHPMARLVYVTDEQAEFLEKMDIHNSGVDEHDHYGPKNVPSYQGDGGDGSSDSGGSSGDSGSSSDSSSGSTSSDTGVGNPGESDHGGSAPSGTTSSDTGVGNPGESDFGDSTVGSGLTSSGAGGSRSFGSSPDPSADVNDIDSIDASAGYAEAGANLGDGRGLADTAGTGLSRSMGFSSPAAPNTAPTSRSYDGPLSGTEAARAASTLASITGMNPLDAMMAVTEGFETAPGLAATGPQHSQGVSYADLAAMQALGWGWQDVPGFPGQTIDQAIASKNANSFLTEYLPTIVGAIAPPGFSLMMNAAKLADGLISGKSTIGQTALGAGLSMVANHFGVPMGVVSGMIEGNYGKATASAATSALTSAIASAFGVSPSLVGAGMNISGVGKDISGGIANAVNSVTGVPESSNLSSIANALDSVLSGLGFSGSGSPSVGGSGIYTAPDPSIGGGSDSSGFYGGENTGGTSSGTGNSRSSGSLPGIFGGAGAQPGAQKGALPTDNPITDEFLNIGMSKDKFIDPLSQLYAVQQATSQGGEGDLAKMMTKQFSPETYRDSNEAVNPVEPLVAENPYYNYGQPVEMAKADPVEPYSPSPYSPSPYSQDFEPTALAARGGAIMASPLMARGGKTMPLNASGVLPTVSQGRENFKHGKHVAGEGDGQSDDIPAWLADGEFVFPADVVSALGNGSTKAGTDKLYDMMHSIRDRARSTKPKDLPPPAKKSALDYVTA
jgi:hypothetical protein